MPQDELKRQQAVNRFLKLEFAKEDELQEIVSLAARICGTESALITLIGNDTQYMRFRHAFAFDSTPRDIAFCEHVISQGSLMVVPNAKLDPRFSANPLVLDKPNIAFYAGVPVTTSDGLHLGSLCVIDSRPGDLDPIQRDMLQVLAKQVIHLMEFDESLKVIRDMYVQAKTSEIEMRSFFESSVDHHLLLDREFKVLAFNQSWASHVLARYGMRMEKGADMSAYVKPGHLADFRESYLNALDGKVVSEERNLRLGDDDHWRRVKFEPARSSTGAIIGVSVNVADADREVKQGLMVHDQQAQLEMIAYMQSHSVRQPLASIIGLVGILRSDVALKDSEAWEKLEHCVRELDDRIHAIIANTGTSS